MTAGDRKKRRNEKLVTAYGYMLGQALEYARYALEGGFEHAGALVDTVRQRLLVAGKQGRAEPALLLLVRVPARTHERCGIYR